MTMRPVAWDGVAWDKVGVKALVSGGEHEGGEEGEELVEGGVELVDLEGVYVQGRKHLHSSQSLVESVKVR